MKKLTASLLLAAVAVSASAQKPGTNSIRSAQNPVFNEWEPKPSPHPIPPEYAGLDAYVILNSVTLDYKYEGKHVTTYSTNHRIIKVLGTRGIESYNTIELPVYHNSKVTDIKARTILTNGKVHDIPKDSMKVSINEQGYYEIDIAMEGVEKNAELELLVKDINTASYFGSNPVQMSIPVQHTFFTMNYPKEMYFEQKGFNGFPQLRDTLLNNRRRQMSVYLANIPALKPEPFSFYNLNTMRCEYRLSYFMEDGDEKIRLNTWDDFSKELHHSIYTLTDKEKAAANKFISTLGITNKGNDWENIRKIEDGIKKQITLFGYVGKKGDDLDSIIAKKAATSEGYLKLFAACFTLAGVDHQVGMAMNKHEHRFDSKFENWQNMDYYLFYFPSVKKYMSPLQQYYRCPMIPHQVTGNKAVFCNIPPNGKLTGQISEARLIPSLTDAESKKTISANVAFDKNMEAEVNINYAYTGYIAADTRTSLILAEERKKKEMIESLIPVADHPEDIVKYSVSAESFENYYTNKPLEITATVKASHLVEKAGKNYLFKLGDMITRQPELYKDEPRVMPVDLAYPTSYSRTITVTIPKGYKILNPQTMRKQADYVDANGKPVIGFYSDYKIVGNTLTVTVDEFYKQTHFGLNEFERFRSVINTASDFNKVALVLGKKM